jgi:hypothetical protein
MNLLAGHFLAMGLIFGGFFLFLYVLVRLVGLDRIEEEDWE